MRVLITGSAGGMGSIIGPALRERHELRGFDREPTPWLTDAVVGDLAELDQVRRATEGMEGVIHLGASAGGGTPWPQVLHNNIVGTYNLFEAARQSGVRRVAFASRAGLLGPYPKAMRRTVDMLPRPNSYYSCSKLFGEGIGFMYWYRYGVEVVCVRIGNFKLERDKPTHPNHLSHGDAVRVFERAITAPDVSFEIVFGVSDSNCRLWDVDHGRRAIGYYPADRSHVQEESEG